MAWKCQTVHGLKAWRWKELHGPCMTINMWLEHGKKCKAVAKKIPLCAYHARCKDMSMDTYMCIYIYMHAYLYRAISYCKGSSRPRISYFSLRHLRDFANSSSVLTHMWDLTVIVALAFAFDYAPTLSHRES